MIKFACIFVLAIAFTTAVVSQFYHQDSSVTHQHSEQKTCDKPEHCCIHSHFAYAIESQTDISGTHHFKRIYIEVSQVIKPKPDLDGPFEPPRC